MPPSKRAKVSDCEDGNQAGSSSNATDTQCKLIISYQMPTVHILIYAVRRSSRLRGKAKPGPSKRTVSQTAKGKLPKRRRATAGCLQKLMQMPVDVFTEVRLAIDSLNVIEYFHRLLYTSTL